MGPKRLWNKPITFRSNKVKKATDKRYITEIAGDVMQMLGTRRDNQQDENQGLQNDESSAEEGDLSESAGPDAEDQESDDLPF